MCWSDVTSTGSRLMVYFASYRLAPMRTYSTTLSCSSLSFSSSNIRGLASNHLEVRLPHRLLASINGTTLPLGASPCDVGVLSSNSRFQ